VRTPAQFLKHLYGVARAQESAERKEEHKDVSTSRKQIIEKDNARTKRASAYNEWLATCQARKQWIADIKTQWEKRKAERQEFLDSLQPHLDQWNAYVDAAEAEFKAAKATVPPARP
jgi:DNA repair exonuclease SbcCD ATPase subunit